MRIQSTILWTPRNPYPNLLERKINNTISKVSHLLPKVKSFPTYLPTKKVREIMNAIYNKPLTNFYI